MEPLDGSADSEGDVKAKQERAHAVVASERQRYTRSERYAVDTHCCIDPWIMEGRGHGLQQMMINDCRDGGALCPGGRARRWLSAVLQW